MAVYLTCTRTRGRQKKHIDICHRCDARQLCRPFQAYIGDFPADAGNETPDGGEMPPAGRTSMTDVIGTLREIRFLLSATGALEKLAQEKIIPGIHPTQISIGDLIRELEKIKFLYEMSSSGWEDIMLRLHN